MACPFGKSARENISPAFVHVQCSERRYKSIITTEKNTIDLAFEASNQAIRTLKIKGERNEAS
jgi:hypothetical protein